MRDSKKAEQRVTNKKHLTAMTRKRGKLNKNLIIEIWTSMP